MSLNLHKTNVHPSTDLALRNNPPNSASCYISPHPLVNPPQFSELLATRPFTWKLPSPMNATTRLLLVLLLVAPGTGPGAASPPAPAAAAWATAGIAEKDAGERVHFHKDDH